jgi:hypothetical protein
MVPLFVEVTCYQRSPPSTASGYLLYLTISGDNGNYSLSKIESNLIWTHPPDRYRALCVAVYMCIL